MVNEIIASLSGQSPFENCQYNNPMTVIEPAKKQIDMIRRSMIQILQLDPPFCSTSCAYPIHFSFHYINSYQSIKKS
jgi:hypothetical protein